MSFLCCFRKLWNLTAIFLFFLTACSSLEESNIRLAKQRNDKAIRKGESLSKDGDVVFRTGRNFTSNVLRQFSLTDKTYSHCGIVRIEQGQKWVYHAIGGEDNPAAVLRKESFEDFCTPADNTGFGVFRYDLSETEKQKMDSLIHQYYIQKIPFDMKFDLETDSCLYCSEFVYKIITGVTEKDYLPVTQIGTFKYVAIDNLFLNDHASPVYQAIFRPVALQ